MTRKADAPRKQQNFRLDAPTRKALEVMAEKEKRSQAQIIELAVEEYFLKHYEEQITKDMAREKMNALEWQNTQYAQRLHEIGFTWEEAETICNWWDPTEHGEWLLTASAEEIREASKPAFEEE